MRLRKIRYSQLNARQKENFNFQKVSAILADYGFVTLRLWDDWHGADFIAQHISGEVLRIQLKSRLAFYKKYEGKGLYVAFGEGTSWYLYPHDDLLMKVLEETKIGSTASWRQRGGYSFPRLSKVVAKLLEPYIISGSTKPLPE
jgi:hypothetical protein